MWILDLGCGTGKDLVSWGVTDSDVVTGVDIDEAALVIARCRFPKRIYVFGRGENLPLEDATIDRVISDVAIPYMDIPKTLAEIHRVLVPGGEVSLSLHPVNFTMIEMQIAFPRLIPLLFRLYVLANGLRFHCTGKTARFASNLTESFQTERGMRIALRSAGFMNISFTCPNGPVCEKLIVDARKEG